MGLKNDSLFNKKTFLLCEAVILALITRAFCNAAYLIFQSFLVNTSVLAAPLQRRPFIGILKDVWIVTQRLQSCRSTQAR
jgi:hypothetical protein